MRSRIDEREDEVYNLSSWASASTVRHLSSQSGSGAFRYLRGSPKIPVAGLDLTSALFHSGLSPTESRQFGILKIAQR